MDGVARAERLAALLQRRAPASGRVVEVGVGRWPAVAQSLARRIGPARLLVTDVDAGAVAAARSLDLEAVQDNVASPRWDVFEGTRFVYALRPPGELVRPIVDFATRLDAELFVRPLADEADQAQAASGRQVIDDGRVAGYAWPA